MTFRHELTPFLILGLAATLACAPQPDPAAETTAALAPEQDEALFEQASLRFFPLPSEAPNPDNALTAAKVDLGRKLYFDKRLSFNETISCDSCHSLASFGVDNLSFSPGDFGELGGRNSPTVLNAALHVAQFWDGRAGDVEEQAGMPILNPVEMAIPSEQFLVDRLTKVPDYQEMFATAFPDDHPALTYQNIARALAAFERTLLTPSRFDRYLEGDLAALTVEEKAGMEAFMMLGCSACHNGYTMGGASFRKFGLSEDYWTHTRSEVIDEGRFAVTGDPEDKYVFKVASLRNVAETGPYFHDGSVETLEDALRVMGSAQLARSMTEEEVAGIAAFLRTLTGELPPEVAAAL
jgi:cytochrome c peroxidase